MKSIYFLSLNGIQFIPYAYGFLRSYAEQDRLIVNNYNWKEPLCKIEDVETIGEKIVDPHVLCASCYVWNHNQQTQVAKIVKEKYPKCRVIFGGPHVPDSSASYFVEHPYVDVLVHGEGEIPFNNLLVEFLNDTPDLRRIPGISFNENMKAIKTPSNPKFPKNLPIPSPYLNGLFKNLITDGNSNAIGLWESNRGCPYSCSFCDWGVKATNKIRLHDRDKIIQEIEYIARHKIEDLYITDCNFGIVKRDLEIAQRLVDGRKKYGFPKRVRIQFTKNSNDTVFEISKLLHDNEMLWGTTLSMQSVDMNVLKAVDRQNIGISNYKKLENRYREQGIPTYTELILGLPLETRESFIRGICTLFDIGIHDDIRVFELALLPNAPMSQSSVRKKYGLKTKFKPLRLTDKNCEREYVELVFGTNTMPNDDWAYCFLFSETVQALHNGGYTRFLSKYLNDNNMLSYRDFYDNLLQYILKANVVSFKSFKRIKKLINDFYNDPDMPQIQRILTQPDMMEFLNSYNPKRKAWQLWTYVWVSVSETIDNFYENILIYLNKQGVRADKKIFDLVQYQKDIMTTLDYDPNVGKIVNNKFNWFEYFFENKVLKEKDSLIHYTDIHMGISHRYELVKNDKKKFLTAAIGYSYPYSKFRHFFHQPDMTIKTP